MTPITYRCSNCFEHTVTRAYDVSHLSIACDQCGEFARFVHSDVLEQFRAFEESPPSELDWEALGMLEKFVVAEGIVRHGRSISEYST